MSAAGGVRFQFPFQAFQTLQVKLQAVFGILVGMIENAYRPAPAAIPNLLQEPRVKLALG